MTNLREATQMALDALENNCLDTPRREVQDALRAALAQEEINAALDRDDEIERLSDLIQEQDKKLAEYEAQPKPVPVAWMHEWNGDVQINNLPAECYGEHWTRTPLYTAPPQREWQGLTDEEIEDACWTEVDQRLRSFTRAIEAKLKEKNT